jgi:hypothetical protein
MNAIQLRERLRQQPFQPFRVFISDGSSYEVRHPEFALVTQREITIALPPRTGDLPLRSVYLDPLHITRVEPIDTSVAQS